MKIICINNDIYIETIDDLSDFSDLLIDEAYDSKSTSIAQCLIDYFFEIWRKTEDFEFEIKKRIDNSLGVVTCLNFNITDNFSEIEVRLTSSTNFELKKKDEVIFEKLFERYFKRIKPLRDRLADL